MFWIFSNYNTSASIVFPNSNMSQYCTFSRIFLGKMLLAITPLPWLFMSEAGQGWQRDRFTKSLRLVALMSDAFQRTSSFCSPINTSSKWSESLNFQSFFSSAPGLCRTLSLLWQLLDRNSCPELWGAVRSLRAELKPCFHCSVRLVLRDYRHHPHLQVSVYRHWRHSPSVNCLLQWVVGAREWGGGGVEAFLSGLRPWHSSSLPAAVFAVSSCQPLGGTGDSEAGLFANWLLVSFQPWATGL